MDRTSSSPLVVHLRGTLTDDELFHCTHPSYQYLRGTALSGSSPPLCASKDSTAGGSDIISSDLTSFLTSSSKPISLGESGCELQKSTWTSLDHPLSLPDYETIASSSSSSSSSTPFFV